MILPETMQYLKAIILGTAIGIGLGLFVVGFRAYFVVGLDGGIMSDGLGRPLVDAPWLARMVLDADRQWAGWAWFAADAAWFWLGLILAMMVGSLATSIGGGAENPLTSMPQRTLIALACLAAAYATNLGLSNLIRLARGHGLDARPSLEALLTRALVDEGAYKQLQEYFEALKRRGVSPPDPKSFGSRAIPLLSDEDQEQKVRHQLQLLDRLPLRVCAAAARGQVKGKEAQTLFHYLAPATEDSLAHLIARAIGAGLRDSAWQDSPPPQPPAWYLDSLLANLPAESRGRMQTTLRASGSATDADWCWTNKTFYRFALDRPPGPARREAIHALSLLEASAAR